MARGRMLAGRGHSEGDCGLFSIVQWQVFDLTDFTGTISPDLISLAAAATRVGVRRFNRPIYCS